MLLPWKNSATVLGFQIDRYRHFARSVVVVVRTGDEAMLKELDRIGFPSSHRVMNPEPEAEMFDSLRCGLNWGHGVDGVSHIMVALGDQPHLREETLVTLSYAAQATPGKICQACFRGKAGHPLILPLRVAAEIAASASKDLRAALAAYPDLISKVETDDPAVRSDIDFPHEYEAARLTFNKDVPHAHSR